MSNRVFSIVAVIVCVAQTAMAQGADAHWPTAAKDGFGTSTTLTSKVWFTLAKGVMTEVFYPTLDVPNVQTLQLLIMSDGKLETELDDTVHGAGLMNGLTFVQVNSARYGEYVILKTTVTDPKRNTVLIDFQYSSRIPLGLYVYYDASLNNSGMHDTAWTRGDALLAADKNRASALISSCGFESQTNGYLGVNDGLTQLRKGDFHSYPRANSGNVVQVAKLKPFDRERGCTLALGFGERAAEALSNARASLASGFQQVKQEYEAGWKEYVSGLPRVPQHREVFNAAAMALKALEDKTYRGAVIASPSTPWGGGPNANEATVSGYHAVWARDLYHVATAFDALGDRATANRLLDYLFRVQQKRDGSFPQNSWVDGRPIGKGLQMDQVGLPLVLAYQLQRNDRQTWLRHIKPAADFIVRRGPRTDQDRWEEKPGYSPATIAAEIAGLVCAAEIATINGDNAAAKNYLHTADEWARKVEQWTVTRGDGGSGYYLRITENSDPNDGANLEINSSTRVVDERKILDAGFLELVRLGVKPANDPLIVESLKLIDQLIKVETPFGDGWYRYNHDAYGATANGGDYDGRNGIGRLWTLLTGERGEYEVIAGDLLSARKRLTTMARFAGFGPMMPEQVWEGTGNGSATPLAWSLAQFIRLALSIEKGRNVEMPKVVWERYADSRG